LKPLSNCTRSQPMGRFHLSSGFVLIILFFVWCPAFPLRADQKENVPAAAIFDAALAKFEADRIVLRKWQYYQTLTTHQFDNAGNVVAKGTWHSIVRPGDPGPLEYTGTKVEGKISFFDSNADEPTPTPGKSGTVKGNPAAKASPAPKTQMNRVESMVAIVRKYNLRNRYDWKRLPDKIAAGEDAYVLAFTPKPRQNTNSREERFFGLLAGRMWISKRDFTVLKMEAALQSPCSLFWIIARVTTFRFTYELEPARGDNRVLRLSKATARTVVTFPFFQVRQQHWQTVDKYEPRTPRGAVPQKAH
jgi:hypothetical protein